jgi:hypothetical protein
VLAGRGPIARANGAGAGVGRSAAFELRTASAVRPSTSATSAALVATGFQ